MKEEFVLDFELLISKFGLQTATFIVCLASGFVPFVNAEIYLVTVSALTTKSNAVAIILISTCAQMIAKSVMYLGGRDVFHLRLNKYKKKIEAVREKYKKLENRSFWFIFLSAFTGFPPFYIVSILSGMMKLNFKWFLISGFSGRLLRFAVAVLAPQLFKELIL